MKLKEHTKFLFIAISSQQNEPQNDIDRFSTDIFHVVHVLESKGVDKANMEIVSDWDDVNWTKYDLGHINRILPKDACNHIKDIDCENLFVVISCHGSLDGIGENGVIKPHNFLEAIKGNNTLQTCIVLFGQCHAGVFHYSNVSDPNKKIVYIGATGMRSGVSTGMKYTSPPNLDITWTANVLVYWFARWFETPVDVDNDGQFSIMDLYKYITDYTNIITNKVEMGITSKYIEEKIKLEYVKQQNGGILTQQQQLAQDANEKLLSLIFVHQECWILNAIPAASMMIEF